MSEWELSGIRTQYWREKGLNKGGFLVCKYAFVVSRPALRSIILVMLTEPLCVFPAFTGSTTYPRQGHGRIRGRRGVTWHRGILTLREPWPPRSDDQGSPRLYLRSLVLSLLFVDINLHI